MQIKKEQLSPTAVKLTLQADAGELNDAKHAVLESLSRNIKVPGFRPGKAPLNMVEKNVDQNILQSEVIDRVLNQLYFEAVQTQDLKPVAQPSVNLTKFVPFTELEFTAEVESVGEVKLPDYKKIKADKPSAAVTAKDVKEVLDNLRQRSAEKSPVERAAKNGDQVTIDFSGVDAENGEPIAGADGKDYPLVIGSSTFIPGFEEELVGAKPAGVKTFTLTFPADYGVAALRSKKVTFNVTVHKVEQLKLPELDDKFAAGVGPFKSLADLKEDVKKQIKAERERESNQTYVNEMLAKIAEKTEVAVPEPLVDEEIDRMESEEKQNLAYRGQTWEEHLAEESITAEAHRERQRENALARVKAGLVLGQIANQEGISVTPEELEVRIQLLKGQYRDEVMQSELDKPESRRDIHSRMMTEKTFDYLLSLAPKTTPKSSGK